MSLTLIEEAIEKIADGASMARSAMTKYISSGNKLQGINSAKHKLQIISDLNTPGHFSREELRSGLGAIRANRDGLAKHLDPNAKGPMADMMRKRYYMPKYAPKAR